MAYFLINIPFWTNFHGIGQDFGQYIVLGQNLFKGRAYMDRMEEFPLVNPGYPWLIAGLESLSIFSFQSMKILHTLFWCFACWNYFEIFKILFGFSLRALTLTTLVMISAFVFDIKFMLTPDILLTAIVAYIVHQSLIYFTTTSSITTSSGKRYLEAKIVLSLLAATIVKPVALASLVAICVLAVVTRKWRLLLISISTHFLFYSLQQILLGRNALTGHADDAKRFAKFHKPSTFNIESIGERAIRFLESTYHQASDSVISVFGFFKISLSSGLKNGVFCLIVLFVTYQFQKWLRSIKSQPKAVDVILIFITTWMGLISLWHYPDAIRFALPVLPIFVAWLAFYVYEARLRWPKLRFVELALCFTLITLQWSRFDEFYSKKLWTEDTAAKFQGLIANPLWEKIPIYCGSPRPLMAFIDRKIYGFKANKSSAKEVLGSNKAGIFMVDKAFGPELFTKEKLNAHLIWKSDSLQAFYVTP